MFALLAFIGFCSIIYVVYLGVQWINKRTRIYNPEHEKIIQEFREKLDKTLEDILNEKW